MQLKLSIIITLIIISHCFSQSETKSGHIIKHESFIKANVRTTITLVGMDSVKFILFDNILSEDQNIVFTHQPYYFDRSESTENKISLPFPILIPGQYVLKYVSTDTTFMHKFIFLK